MTSALKPNDLDAHFMPFTPQRQFKKKPRMIARAEGMFYYSDDGRKMIDASAGLWCVNAGHNHPKIVEAIQKQAAELDYAPNFSYGHPLAFQTASRLCAEMPGDLDHVFFSNSGSESVDTAVKIALGYHRVRGKGTKLKILSRERGYHGVNICGVSLGGLYYNRKMFSGALMPNVDFLPHTHNLEHNAFSPHLPEWGAHLADSLEGLIQLHDAENVAAVIIEPVAGSTGVLVPPKGYLERIRAICDKHDVLLILDEVITAWGRLGKATASEYFNVQPDIITSAKGINSGTVPMGATFVRKGIYDAFMTGGEYGVEFMHGYTYSGHPLACAAAMAAQDVYKNEGMFENAAKLEKKWSDAFQSLKGAPHVIDIRTIGLMAGVELDPGSRDAPNEKSRAWEVLDKMFFDENIVMRFTGNTLAFSPPLIVNENQIDEIVTKLRKTLETVK
ncbi:MAG: aminotransferase class III-fold pyridoxal phosphate-dependent enzyme [Alphaproteobacteria bacterium]|nr:aminotransferase class III-fold pyridoxal phosphate-dependent enzyme [Alphaproteobacteria bacterium]